MFMLSKEYSAGSKRVLLIDDEADIRDIAQMTLDITMGWQILVADGGRNGVMKARDSKPDLIILDIMMPDLDGFATLEHLRSDPETCDIPVVFLSAKNGPELKQRISAAGACGIVPKPFNAMTLGNEVAALVDW